MYAGNDTAFGRAGADKLFGSSGSDTIYTGTLEEGDGESDAVSSGGGAEDTVYLGGKDHSGQNIGDSCENTISY
ncbi:MAG TPA: hypothetical protein VKA73_02485 [Rubrobacter sp.]|nr:hypothetical protein [Rubrobacter sp.]